MLDKSLTIRTDALLTSWLDRLASDADRSPGSVIRDLIYLMVFDQDLWQSICERLKSDQISYNK